jgi:Ni/Fe-hydrogenase subunit HybB-like protein
MTLVTLGAYAMAMRYIHGLGATTNMSDGRGWGIWISFDLYCGVALAAGGFVLAAVVYIFGLKKYHAVVRPAILTAFLGYTLVILALLVDLGKPWDIWHFMFHWNIHSPLFEVGLCVMTYTVVLALEFSPALFERLNWRVPLKLIRAIQIPLVIAGITLSTLHQSSLGTMTLTFPYDLHALWYSPIIPFLFFTSAIAVGLAMVIFESTWASKSLKHKLPMGLLSGLGKAMPWVLGIYLLLKLVDLIEAGELGLIFSAYPQNLLWWAEVGLGVILPMILFSMSKVRNNSKVLFFSALLVILGLILNRFNVSMLALQMREGFTYFPSWMEIAISVGLVADGILIYWLANRYLPIFQHEEEEEEEAKTSCTEAA